MNKEHDKSISRLKSKLSSLIMLYKTTKREKDTLYIDKLELLENIEYLRKKNQELIDKYEVLKLARNLSFSNEDTKNTKDKLSTIVREIDKCISLLNK